MKITKLEEQGMRLTMCLGRSKGHMTLPELAQKEGLSEALVAKVLGKLKSKGIVKTVRGRNGGYVLGEHPKNLSVTLILKSLGRPIIDGCFQLDNKCRHAQDCSIRPIWQTIEKKVTEVFDKISLEELIGQELQVREHLVLVTIENAKDEIAETTTIEK